MCYPSKLSCIRFGDSHKSNNLADVQVLTGRTHQAHRRRRGISGEQSTQKLHTSIWDGCVHHFIPTLCRSSPSIIKSFKFFLLKCGAKVCVFFQIAKFRLEIIVASVKKSDNKQFTTFCQETGETIATISDVDDEQKV